MNFTDCHADTLTQIPDGESLWENTCSLDLRRAQSFAGSHTQIFAVFEDKKKMERENLEQAFLRRYEKALSHLQSGSRHLKWCKDAEDMRLAHEQKKTAAFLSIEDVSIMGSLAKDAFDLGFRFAQLCWNYENEYACGALSGQEKGLSEKGKSLAKELLKKGMVLDLSHLSDQGVLDIFSMTDKPVIATHSNVREICGHPRNLKKEQVKELIRRRGLLGLNFYAPFVGEMGMGDFLLHIDAVCELGGEDILAIGSDFDGCKDLMEGILDVGSIPALWRYLEKNGVGIGTLEKIFWKNANRFLCQNMP